MKKLLTFLFIYTCILSVYTFAQTQQIASVYHDVHKINSKILNEKRTFWVRVPLNYNQTNEKFPVVYMLDGHAPQPSMMAGIIEQQAWGRQMPEMILVSIQNLSGRSRSRDMTPSDDGKGGQVGGSDKFLQFIEKEIMPLVEKKYRTQPFEIFAGHSLGGLTVVYSFITRPDLFDAYIAASPVLHYDNYFVIKEAEKFFDKTFNLNKTMFLGLGDEPEYEKGWKRFQKLLKDKKPKNFEYEFREFKEDNHASVVLPIYYAGLRKIYRGWDSKNIQTVSQLERHYKKLSTRFGYEVLIPEETLNRIGYQYLRLGNKQNAINVFKKNVKNYPESPNVYDSLAEAYEKNGQKKLAQENYQKAYDLAVKKGDDRLANFVKTRLEKLNN